MDTPVGMTKTEGMKEAQENFERRFSCPICLDPKLKMVVSACQHRFCSDCLYKNDQLISAMRSCPTCQRPDAFPEKRPSVPEDAVEIQRQLGVTECPLEGCNAGVWIWNLENHIDSCPYAITSPSKPGSKRKHKGKKGKESDSHVAKQQKQEVTTRSKQVTTRSKEETSKTSVAAVTMTTSSADVDLPRRVTRSCSQSKCAQHQSPSAPQQQPRYPTRQQQPRYPTRQQQQSQYCQQEGNNYGSANKMLFPQMMPNRYYQSMYNPHWGNHYSYMERQNCYYHD